MPVESRSLFLFAPMLVRTVSPIYHLINRLAFQQPTHYIDWLLKLFVFAKTYVSFGFWRTLRILTCGLLHLFPSFQVFLLSLSITVCMVDLVQSSPNSYSMDLISLLFIVCVMIPTATFHGKCKGPSGPEFQTAVERAYPVALCEAILHLFLHHCFDQGVRDVPTLLSEASHIATPFFRHHLRGGVGVQPRGRQLAVLPNGFADFWVPSSQLTRQQLLS